MAREEGEAVRDDAIRCLHARYQRGELTFHYARGMEPPFSDDTLAEELR